MKTLQPLLEHFRMTGVAQSEIFRFSLEYCQMVFLLLDFLAAEYQPDWNLHLETFRETLYYDCAYDYKYFMWEIIYICDMEQLPLKHPYLYQKFIRGYHAVSISKQSSYFNSVSTHMALEKSLNRNSKTKYKTSILHLRYNTSSKHTFFLRLCSRKTFSLVMLVETEMSGRDSRVHLRTISPLLLKNFSKTIVIQETKFVSINHSFI